MSYKAIYTYAWDLAEAGVDAALAEFHGLGLDTVTMAASYHAGKFLRPHGAGKVYFPEDGTIYFRHDPARYGAIRPVPNSMLAERDVLGELTEAGAMGVTAWLVLLHNTRLGMAHPDSVVRNAFGDPYVYSLCPSAPEARAYAVALARDVTQAYPVRGIVLETPGFMVYRHGYHHEFALVAPNPWLDNHLGLCFCPHCVARAEAAGIDAKRLKAQSAEAIEAWLGSDIDTPPDMAEAAWRADIVSNSELHAYLRFRCDVVTSLVAEIRAAVRPDAEVSVLPGLAHPGAAVWYEGGDIGALADAAGIIEAGFYEAGAGRVRADLFDIRRRLGGRGQLRAILRPGHPDFAGRAEFLAAISALRADGVTDLAFYNWGHLRPANLAWIADALRE